jgi:CRP-like cAMP-binding protein
MLKAPGKPAGIRASVLRDAIEARASLRRVLLNFAYVYLIQTAHTAQVNARSNLEQRLARWILMGHDRIQGDNLALSHELIATMLGVRRAGVTVGVRSLVKRGLVSASRGHIIVTNRAGLESLAGSAYGSPEAEYRRLIG